MVIVECECLCVVLLGLVGVCCVYCLVGNYLLVCFVDV